jgi:hypothetical protein
MGKWLLSGAVGLLGAVSSAISIYTFVMPAERAQAALEASRETEMRIAAGVVEQMKSLGFDLTKAQEQLSGGNASEAITSALELVALPEQDETLKLKTDVAYQITPHKLPLGLYFVREDTAIGTLVGEKTEFPLAKPVTLPAPAERCSLTLMKGVNEGANRGYAEVLIHCRPAS